MSYDRLIKKGVLRDERDAELEAEADRLLAEWTYSRGTNEDGELYTEDQLVSKRKYERPLSAYPELLESPCYDTYHLDDTPEPPSIDDLAERLGLTANQRDVLLLLMEGRTQTEIGAALGIGQPSVSKIVQRIREKCRKEGILPPI